MLPYLFAFPLAALATILLQTPADVPAEVSTMLAAVAVALPVVASGITEALRRFGYDFEVNPAILARWVAVGVWGLLVVVGPVDLPGEYGAMPTDADPLAWFDYAVGLVTVVGLQVGFIGEGSRMVHDNFLKRS